VEVGGPSPLNFAWSEIRGRGARTVGDTAGFRSAPGCGGGGAGRSWGYA
jgi:hypothetical protein